MLTKSYKVLVPELYLVAYSFVQSETKAEDIVADCFKILLQLPNNKRRLKVNEFNFNLKDILLEMVKNQSLKVVNSKKIELARIDK